MARQVGAYVLLVGVPLLLLVATMRYGAGSRLPPVRRLSGPTVRRPVSPGSCV
jgi:hypothetical protein